MEPTADMFLSLANSATCHGSIPPRLCARAMRAFTTCGSGVAEGGLWVRGMLVGSQKLAAV